MALPVSGLTLSYAEEFNNIAYAGNSTVTTGSHIWNTTLSGGVRTLSGNAEQQFYMDPGYKSLGVNPFSVNNGVLNITAAPSSAAVKSEIYGYNYTSGVLTTQDQFSQQYGYFETRARIPEGGKGLWPAFWMLPAKGGWPPEIDILEAIGSAPWYLHQGVHSNYGSKGLGANTVNDNSKAFHTYGVNWTKDTITFYYDGAKRAEFATPADFHTPMYMILNQAVGGNWPGSPDSTTDWSKANYQVDYVRAYKNDGSGTSTPTPTPTTSTGDAVLSNAMNPLDLSDSYLAAATGASTTRTYTASQMAINGVSDPTTATVSYNANKDITVTNNGAWNAIKNATVKSNAVGNVTLRNFVDAEIALGDTARTINVTDVKRGNIVTGAGSDTITVAAQSNGTDGNVVNINAGGGNNKVAFSGASNTATAITTGSGSDTVTISDQAGGSVNAGGGNDRIIISSTGNVRVSGGAGQDSFEVSKDVHATITDFNASEDKLLVDGVTLTSSQVKISNGNTIVDLGNGASVTLAGVSLSGSALGLASPTMTATLSNAMDAGNLSDSFTASATGANTTRTYTASQMAINGVTDPTTATMSYDANGGLAVTNDGAWNAIKNATVKSSLSGSVTVKNFVNADIALGNNGNTVNVTDAKRGTIATGSGSDKITVSAFSNTSDINTMKINGGDGNNTVGFSGASNTETAITTGSGSDTITISGQAGGSVNAGGGDDRINTRTGEATTVTGGTGRDVFSFMANAHATITDYTWADDRIELAGVRASDVRVRNSGGSTFIDIGSSGLITVAGVTHTQSGLNLSYV